VSKEASDMVLADDNFASIVSAVEEGRGIYDNIKKFITYLLSCNIAEVLVVFLAMMFVRDPVTGLFVLPLLPVQLLWMNLVTDGLPALALGVEPYETDIMKRRPRPTKEKVLNRGTNEFILFVGIFITAVTLYLFYLELPAVGRARTIAFTALVVFEMAVALSMRSPHYLVHRAFENKKLLIAIFLSILLQVLIVYVPVLNPIFDTVPLTMHDWIEIFVAAFFIFLMIEFNKTWKIERRITGAFVKHKNEIANSQE
jgi:Ca2+-transporting ATPase